MMHTEKRSLLNYVGPVQCLPSSSSIEAVFYSFNSMPDDCIRLVFIRLSLQNRVVLRIICQRWKSVVESMCQSVRKLTLFGGEFKVQYTNALKTNRNVLLICKNQDSSPKLTIYSSFMPHLFSNVDQLEMNFHCTTYEIVILQYLECWSLFNRLSSLQLNIKTYDKFLSSLIWSHISKLSKLNTLIIDGDSFISFNQLSDERLVFFGQLRHLKVKPTYRNSPRVIRFIGPNMRRLVLEEIISSKFSYLGRIEKALLAKPNMVAQMTHLDLSYRNYYNKTLEGQRLLFNTICDHFVSLVFFRPAFIPEIPINETLTRLSQLLQLTKLHLLLGPYNLDHDLPRTVQFGRLECLVLEISTRAYDHTGTPLEQTTVDTRLVQLFIRIPAMFPVLQQLKFASLPEELIIWVKWLLTKSSFKGSVHFEIQSLNNIGK